MRRLDTCTVTDDSIDPRKRRSTEDADVHGGWQTRGRSVGVAGERKRRSPQRSSSFMAEELAAAHPRCVCASALSPLRCLPFEIVNALGRLSRRDLSHSDSSKRPHEVGSPHPLRSDP